MCPSLPDLLHLVGSSLGSCKWHYFFPFYGCVINYIMYHIFIHSSADGHFSCFHVLAIVNSAAVNIGVYLFKSRFLSGYMPRSAIAKLFYGFQAQVPK